ncbi:MAG: PQQ-binding-like beta-propeller repeat protein [Candidatus Hadarchaeota archaeon]
MKRITNALLVGSLASVAIVALLLSSGTVGAQLADSPWPMFGRDTKHTGRSPYSTENVDGTIKWNYGGDGWYPKIFMESSPAIGLDGTIYIGSESDNNLYAIKPDGTKKWHFTTYGMVRSSPAVGSDGTIYVGSAENNVGGETYLRGTCVLYAINPDGTKKWSFDVGGNITGTFSSPAIGSDGTIYYGSGDYIQPDWLSGGKIYAINPDGTEKWSYSTGGGGVYAAPAIGSDGTVYVGSTSNKTFYAINPDGTLKWSFVTGGMVTGAAAVGENGTIYFGSTDKNLYALNPDGTERWHFTTGGWLETAPAVGADGAIYVGSFDNNLYAINPDGTEKWHFTTEGSAWGVESSPTISSDGTIYVSSKGGFYAINPDGTLKWRALSAGVPAASNAAINSDGTIYVGSWNGLYAFSATSQNQINEENIASGPTENDSGTTENQTGYPPGDGNTSFVYGIIAVIVILILAGGALAWKKL